MYTAYRDYPQTITKIKPIIEITETKPGQDRSRLSDNRQAKTSTLSTLHQQTSYFIHADHMQSSITACGTNIPLLFQSLKHSHLVPRPNLFPFLSLGLIADSCLYSRWVEHKSTPESLAALSVANTIWLDRCY